MLKSILNSTWHTVSAQQMLVKLSYVSMIRMIPTTIWNEMIGDTNFKEIYIQILLCLVFTNSNHYYKK